jgi:hypothetical protein
LSISAEKINAGAQSIATEALAQLAIGALFSGVD